MILGTAAYMAPEQARGKVVDKRADIWAFGVVLYEMLAGRSVFAAEDVSLTLAEVMKSDPDWTRLPAGTPPALRQLLIRCLQKEPRLRLRDIGDARLALEDASQSSDVNAGTTASHVRPTSRGPPEVYVQPLVGAGQSIRVSRSGGTMPKWSADGSRVYFLSPDGWIMEAPVAQKAGQVSVGTPVRAAPASGLDFEPSADGERFLILGDTPLRSIAIVNWQSLLPKN
jgi:serine/threonine protein kinase